MIVVLTTPCWLAFLFDHICFVGRFPSDYIDSVVMVKSYLSHAYERQLCWPEATSIDSHIPNLWSCIQRSSHPAHPPAQSAAARGTRWAVM